ncbi:hypothetical protein [Streptomyces sp. NPDC056723]|uniref:hypothetical protein n=1 Tax=unclassified Streptomyces TaxID=2593676 RepID=UPI003645F47E
MTDFRPVRLGHPAAQREQAGSGAFEQFLHLEEFGDLPVGGSPRTATAPNA